MTGASDGIGREYAVQLASKGYGVLLVARSKEKLDDVAREIRATGGTAEIQIIDFSKPTAQNYEDLRNFW